jgi:hypothetical protein
VDRIDHCPQFPNEDQNAGRVAGEIRALREQQENLYYRDEALNEVKHPSKSKKKSSSASFIESDIGYYEATRIIVHQTPTVQPNDFVYGLGVGIFLMFVGIVIFFVFFAN